MDNITVEPQEEALIGACLRGGKETFAQAREVVKVESLRNNAYANVWAAMETLFGQEMGIDTITVGDEMERAGTMKDFVRGQWSGRALLSDLRSNGDPRNVMTYAENVQDYSAKRKLDMFFTKCVSWAKNGRRAKDILSDVESELGKIVLYGVQDEYTVPFKVAVSEAYDQTDAASRGEVTGIETGLKDLDNILGGLYGNAVYIVAARPGQGKTALLSTIALNAAKRGKRIAIFSLEMSRAQVAQRLISQWSEIDLSRIIKGKLHDGEWGTYTSAVEQVAALPIIINDLSSININNIRQTARKIHAAGGLDLIIIDYIQLAGGDGTKVERREQEVSQVSRGLKWLTRELDIPILAAAQMSRAVEQRSDRRPVLSDLRESGSLEQDAYGVWFLHAKDEVETDNKPIDIIVAKHRNGPVGTCETIFRKPITRFENAARFAPR